MWSAGFGMAAGAAWALAIERRSSVAAIVFMASPGVDTGVLWDQCVGRRGCYMLSIR